MSSKAKEVKVVLLGDSGVGKSSLVLRFVVNDFKPYSEATIGASFFSKLVVTNNTPLKFQIWDTAGQEKYHSLAPMYYRGAAAAILVYDITNKGSFEQLKLWVTELQAQGPENIVLAIAGNKSDLASNRVITAEQGLEYAQSLGKDTIFRETSAKNDSNVHDIFVRLAEKIPGIMTEDMPTNEFVKPIQPTTKSMNKNSLFGGFC